MSRSFENAIAHRHCSPHPSIARVVDPHARVDRTRDILERRANAARASAHPSTMATTMRVVALTVLAILARVSGAHASAFVGTDANFDKAVMNSGKHLFVKYLAPW